MNTLAQYLEGKNRAEVARAARISGAYLTQLAKGDRHPGLDVAVRIEAATGGEVPVSSWPGFSAVAAALVARSGDAA